MPELPDLLHIQAKLEARLRGRKVTAERLTSPVEESGSAYRILGPVNADAVMRRDRVRRAPVVDRFPT